MPTSPAPPSSSPRGPFPSTPTTGTSRPLTDRRVAELLTALETDRTDWYGGSGGRWSLAGAQAKLALAKDSASGRWALPSGAAPTTHILKPTIPDLAHHDLDEHLCLAAARLFGLPAATSSVERFGPHRVLVVERYDRLPIDGRIVRLHQEDCCQALGVHPDDKYQSDGGPGLDALVTLLRSVVQPDPAPDVEALVHAVVFNWLILGSDAHAKNYSLLLDGPQVHLAPLYDLASAAPYDPEGRRTRLAQKVGGEYRPRAVTTRHWIRVATQAGLDPASLLEQIEAMATQLPDALSSAAAATQLSRADRTHANAVVDAIARWTDVARRSLTDGPAHSSSRSARPPRST